MLDLGIKFPIISYTNLIFNILYIFNYKYDFDKFGTTKIPNKKKFQICTVLYLKALLEIQFLLFLIFC